MQRLLVILALKVGLCSLTVLVLFIILVACARSPGDWIYSDPDWPSRYIVLHAQENNLPHRYASLFVSCFDSQNMGPRLSVFFELFPSIGIYGDTPSIYDPIPVAIGWDNREMEFASPNWKIDMGGRIISPPRDSEDVFLESLAKHTEFRMAVPTDDDEIVMARFHLEGYNTAVKPVQDACRQSR